VQNLPVCGNGRLGKFLISLSSCFVFLFFSVPCVLLWCYTHLSACEWYVHEIYLPLCCSGMILHSLLCSGVNDIMVRESSYKVTKDFDLLVVYLFIVAILLLCVLSTFLSCHITILSFSIFILWWKHFIQVEIYPTVSMTFSTFIH